MRGGAGQVTLFFIVGLVLLFTVAIIYLMLAEDDQVERAIIDAADNPLLNSYLSSCVDAAADDILASAGRRGGLPYGSPDARMQPYPYAMVPLGDDEERIIYGITRNEDPAMLKPYAYSAPRYPEWGLKLSDAGIILDHERAAAGEYVAAEMIPYQDGYFGDVNFPAPCSRKGMNAPGTLNWCRQYPGYPPGTSPELSAQEVMEEEFVKRLMTCVSDAEFEEILGRDVEKLDNPVVKIAFTQANVVVHVDYPLRFSGEADTVTVPFSRTYDVRYLPIAEFAFDLAREDTRDIRFQIDDPDHYTKLASWRPGFTVTIGKRGILSAAGRAPAYLITITDDRSKIAKASFRFNFLVEDRPPMLDWVTKDEALAAPDSCPAWDPDDVRPGCEWSGDESKVVASAEGEQDCLMFDGGNPVNGDAGSAYACG